MEKKLYLYAQTCVGMNATRHTCPFCQCINCFHADAIEFQNGDECMLASQTAVWICYFQTNEIRKKYEKNNMRQQQIVELDASVSVHCSYANVWGVGLNGDNHCHLVLARIPFFSVLSIEANSSRCCCYRSSLEIEVPQRTIRMKSWYVNSFPALPLPRGSIVFCVQFDRSLLNLTEIRTHSRFTFTNRSLNTNSTAYTHTQPLSTMRN